MWEIIAEKRHSKNGTTGKWDHAKSGPKIWKFAKINKRQNGKKQHSFHEGTFFDVQDFVISSFFMKWSLFHFEEHCLSNLQIFDINQKKNRFYEHLTQTYFTTSSHGVLAWSQMFRCQQQHRGCHRKQCIIYWQLMDLFGVGRFGHQNLHVSQIKYCGGIWYENKNGYKLFG